MEAAKAGSHTVHPAGGETRAQEQWVGASHLHRVLLGINAGNHVRGSKRRGCSAHVRIIAVLNSKSAVFLPLRGTPQMAQVPQHSEVRKPQVITSPLDEICACLSQCRWAP